MYFPCIVFVLSPILCFDCLYSWVIYASSFFQVQVIIYVIRKILPKRGILVFINTCLNVARMQVMCLIVYTKNVSKSNGGPNHCTCLNQHLVTVKCDAESTILPRKRSDCIWSSHDISNGVWDLENKNRIKFIAKSPAENK